MYHDEYVKLAHYIGTQVAKEHFQKTAGLGGGVGGLMGPLPAALGGALESETGGAALGAGLGSFGGMTLGAGVAGLIARKYPLLAVALASPLTLGGSAYGGHLGQEWLRKPKGLEHITGK